MFSKRKKVYAIVTFLSLCLSIAYADKSQSERIKEMKSKIREEAKRIQEEMGVNRSFGLVITNDRKMGELIAKNATLIEKKQSLDKHISQRESKLGKQVSEMQSTKDKLDSYRSMIETKKQELAAMESSRKDEIKSMVQSHKKELSELSQRIDELQAVKSELAGKVSKREVELSKLIRKITALNKQMKSMVKIARDESGEKADGSVATLPPKPKENEIISIGIESKN